MIVDDWLPGYVEPERDLEPSESFVLVMLVDAVQTMRDRWRSGDYPSMTWDEMTLVADGLKHKAKDLDLIPYWISSRTIDPESFEWVELP